MKAPAANRMEAAADRGIPLLRFVRRSAVALLTLLAFFFILFDLVQSYRGFDAQAKEMREGFVTGQKAQVRREVSRVVEMLAYEQDRIKNRARTLIRERVYEAHAIATNLYHTQGGNLGRRALRGCIREALRPIRFANGTGYLFATRMNGVEELFADRPELEGVDLLGVRDGQGRYVIREMIALVQSQGEGFTEYLWSKPGNPGADHRKISFVKAFQPLDCFLGAGVYVDDISSEVQRELLERTSRIRFGKEGYIFVHGRDGTVLVSHGRVVPGNRKLWEVYAADAPQSREVFHRASQVAGQAEGGFIEYIWPRLTRPEESAPKLSFVKGFPAFSWMVGAGVYLDDIEQEVDFLRSHLQGHFKERILLGLLFFLLLLGIFLMVLMRLNRFVQRDFDAFVTLLERVDALDKPMEIDTLRSEELRLVGRAANRMLAQKQSAQNEKQLMEQEVVKNRRLESIGLLAGGIAHDFNNLLTGIFGNIELATLELEPGHPARLCLDSAHGALQRAKGLTGQLLTFSKGGGALLEQVNLTELCQEVAGFTLAGGTVKALYDLPGDLPPAWVDPGQMAQVISNIVLNAVQAMPDGGLLRVSAGMMGRDEVAAPCREALGACASCVWLRFQDEGEGMSPDQMERVFDPFYTTRAQGSGLGLSTAHSIVRRHGGLIQVASERGKGSVFTLYLPVTAGPPEQREVSGPAPAEPAPGGYRVLVMDDEKPVREVLGRMLDHLGHAVAFAAEGREAVLAYGEGMRTGAPYDLVVMDLTVPGGMGGVEALEGILALDSEARVVVASGYAEDEVLADYGRYGFVGRLVKPFRLEQLREEVERVGRLTR